MISRSCPALSRRQVLAGLGATLLSTPPSASFANAQTDKNGNREFRLVARAGTEQIVPANHPPTPVWHFGSVPGPEIRLRQGETARISVTNNLEEETTVHWHGLRLPNGMDGVPHLTQRPIGAGETFIYEFVAQDAGTFWYHPHQRSFEQVGRGLYGAFIVDEKEAPAFDREVTLVLDDWRLMPDASIADDFGNIHDKSHAGRIGNTVTVNGRLPGRLALRSGERLRLRLINAANARIFALEFSEHRPVIIAIDGHPVAPHTPDDGRIVLAPAMRIDLVLDGLHRPGSRFAVHDTAYPSLESQLFEIAYDAQALRPSVPEHDVALPDNPLPEPNIDDAVRHDVVFSGGMMGRVEMTEMRKMIRRGLAWMVNGVAAEGHVLEPMATLDVNRTHVLAMHNQTGWHHPIHLHGHTFRVLRRNGKETRYREWQDTVLMAPDERVDIAFVADNPGDWMFHCHVLEHQAAGMAGVIRVA